MLVCFQSQNSHSILATLEFSVREAANAPVSRESPVPDEWISWNYNPEDPSDPRIAVDKDDIPVLLWIPQFLPKQALVSSLLI